MDLNISSFKIIVIFLVLGIIGIALVPQLSLDLNPRYDLPTLTISYILPNASPDRVERSATAPLENTFSQLSGIREITSVSKYDKGSITLTFGEHVDIGLKRFEVSSLIRQVYRRLPKGLSYPQVLQQNGQTEEQNSPFLIYSVNAPLAPHQIHDVTEKVLKLPISQLSGVKKVEIRGAEELQISIQFNKDKLYLYDISPEDIRNKVQESFQVDYLGILTNSSGQQFFTKTDNHLASIEQMETLIIKMDHGFPVRLKDIASIYIEEQEPSQFYRINGLNAVTLSIYAQTNVNRLALAKAIKAALFEAEQQLSEEFHVTKDYDESEYLEKELHKIYKRSGLSILVLILFIFLINRNFKYLLILFTGILVNLCLTSILLYFLKIDLHIYSLAGITISFGLIVDNAIVMLDHIYKKNNTKVFRALLGASLTTISALMIIFFLPEEERQNLTEFSQVITITLSISLLVALFFTPAMYNLLFSGSRKSSVPPYLVKNGRTKVNLFNSYYHFIQYMVRFRKSFIILLMLIFGFPVFLLPAKWEDHEFYNKIIGSDLYQEVIRPYSDKILGGTLRLFVRGVFEKSGYRSLKETKLYIIAELPYGNTLQQMNSIMANVEDYLSTVQGIDKFITSVYTGQYARIVVTFEEKHERTLPYKLKARLIARSLDWAGVEWDIYGVGREFSNSLESGISSYRVSLKGYNYAALEKQAEIMGQKLLKHRRVQEVNLNQRLIFTEKPAYELVLNFDKEKLGAFNINQAEVIGMIQARANPLEASFNVLLDQDLMPVYLKEQSSKNFSKHALFESVQFASNGSAIKLSNFSDLNLIKTTNVIHKENRQYIRIVGFDYYGNEKFGNDYLKEVLQEMEKEMPVGYSAEQIGWKWNFDKTKKQYGLLLALIIAIFFICAILFENLKQPFFIIATIPISFIGLFLIFYIFDLYFDQGGYAAFVMLGGLVVNAAIFIINDLNNLRRKNYNRAVFKAVTGKAVPILLTIFSTCLGLVPFIIDGQDEVFWFSLAIGTIGGLIFSLFAVFVCLPVFLFKKVEENKI